MTSERILLVEDNSMNRRVAEFLLKSHGYTVYEARDGQEALEMVQVYLPDLILMDLQLPGLDGFTVTRMIKENATTKDIPVVALTAYAMRGDAERAFAVGCDGYITKPIDPDQFPNTVASYLRHRKSKEGRQPDIKPDLIEHKGPARHGQMVAEAALIQKTRIDTVGAIASAFGHEARNLLGALKTCVQVLRRNPHITPEDSELLDIIQTGSQRLNEFLSQLTTFGHNHPPRFEEVDLHELIEEVLNLLQSDDRCSRSIVIRRNFDPSIHAIQVDRYRLGQLFWNLFLNAIQAMGEQGELHVETLREGAEVEIFVRDTGPGIPETILPNIFEPFYSTKPKGIGLGLAIVRRIVEEHGGQIAAHDEKETGTCFTVRLPVEPKTETPDVPDS